MELSKLLIGIAIVVFILLICLFPEFRALMFGWTKLFIKDMATTPEGASAIYENKIDDAQDKYNKANNALRLAAGKLEVEQNKLKDLQNKLKKVETECEALVREKKIEMAQIKADERSETIADIERSKKLVDAYTTAKNDALEVNKACEATLRKLKREAKEVVENMKVKAQMNEIYDSMDDLKNATATDKLLSSIKEKNEDLNATVAGAKVLHDNKTSTKIQKANEQAKKLETDDYLNSLMKKYK